MKVCTIVGARPQFIKAAVVSRVIAKTKGLQEIIVHTGQHYDEKMSAQFFEELDIPKPMYQLKVGSSSHGKQTGQMLIEIEQVLLDEEPDVVLVYGDTNSTLAGALAAVKLHIPVSHVEAGLRSFNRKMPEEINRITVDHISSFLFAPTQNGYQRLLKEGIDDSRVANVGDVMFDAALFYNEKNVARETIVEQLKLTTKQYILATIHRAENTDTPERLENICRALIDLTTKYPIVFPLHPRTKNVLANNPILKTMQEKLMLIEPVGYLDMLALEQHAKHIITDSGGVQKEAYFNQVPCITLRNETEWIELVDAGWNKLCSPDLPFSLHELIIDANPSAMTDSHQKLYGNGDAGQKIASYLVNIYGNSIRK